MPGTAQLSRTHRGLLLQLQRQALQYFVDNQTPAGLILDRQRNHGTRRRGGLCSTAATGMGFIALALASAPPYRLMTRRDAVGRVRAGLDTALNRLPHDRGVMPHFLDAESSLVAGSDHRSTVDSAWLLAGALWAAAFLGDPELEDLATRLNRRVDWRYWTGRGPHSLLRHGQASDGRFLGCSWDRLNGETIFMYVLACGAKESALPASVWRHLRPFYGTLGGLNFNNSDLGLFVFQYGLDLLDLRRWRAPGGINLAAEAATATEANYRACRALADTFATYRRCWGLSAGDGPAEPPAELAYRCYAPSGPVDGTAHVTATLASIAHCPDLVLENLRQAGHAHGRYGFSNVNLDRGWVGPDMVAIDAAAAVLALDNVLMDDRVRNVFHTLPCVRRGLERSGFVSPVQTPRVAA